ncbi:MAG: sigma-70 family RNA polymerase sigma factor [Bacteroidetes bacterium]|nr:sigma-70 family RNA polymerase sigma factor [Bacteroidota bacterium]
MQTEIEKQYIEDAKTDPKCFEPLYVLYYERILKFVYKRIESLDDTREVTAIIFTKALANIKKYEYQGFPFSSWLYRIAINEIAQFYRESDKRRVISLDKKGIDNMAEETTYLNKDLVSALKKALLYLSQEELILIELRYFEERPFSELGQILQITENNAKVKTYRVVDKLKNIFNKIA